MGSGHNPDVHGWLVVPLDLIGFAGKLALSIFTKADCCCIQMQPSSCPEAVNCSAGLRAFSCSRYLQGAREWLGQHLVGAL